MISVGAEGAGVGNIGAFRALRTLRALRPLRAVSRWEGMKVCLLAYTTGWPKGDFFTSLNSSLIRVLLAHFGGVLL